MRFNSDSVDTSYEKDRLFSEIRVVVPILCVGAVEILGLVTSASPYPVVIIAVFIIVEACILSLYFTTFRLSVLLLLVCAVFLLVTAVWKGELFTSKAGRERWSEYFYFYKLLGEILLLTTWAVLYSEFLRTLRTIQSRF